MTLRFVLLQHLLHLTVEGSIAEAKALGNILMYCGFTDAEFFGGGAAGGPVLDDVRGQFTGPLLDVGSQKHHSQHDDPCSRICRGAADYVAPLGRTRRLPLI